MATAGNGISVASENGTTQDSLVHDTRREITEIIREVAVAARSDRTVTQFSSLLVDRVLRAMSAEGVVVWHRDNSERERGFQPLQRAGRITDRSINVASVATHQTMLNEVAREGIPVVVPATPGANEPTVPANPAEVPAAVVPIDHGDANSESVYLLEVFLEPDGGVTTQRGYLRFVAQMADLAGEFLRAAELRRLKRTQLISQRVDAAVENLHRRTRGDQVQAATVDAAAELFDFDRAAICIIDSPHTTLAAVSHVNKIDHRSEAARYLTSAANIDLVDGVGTIDQDDNNGVCTIVVAPTDASSGLRLVGIGNDFDDEKTTQLKRFLDHAKVALHNASQFDAIPGGQMLASLVPALQAGRVKWWMRPIFTACVLTMLIIVAMMPVPMYVHSPATIRPADVQRLTAPRDAVVKAIHVQHGQSVLRGDALVTLLDFDLEQQITRLIGRKAELVEKRAHSKKLLMAAKLGERNDGLQAQSELALTEEEIHWVEIELSQLQQIQSQLVIRADRSGTIDAWRLKERLDGRPLTRGDPLMQVIATDSPWIVDALVPQNRISHVRGAVDRESLQVQVALESTPDRRWSAEFLGIGPTALQKETGVRSSSVRLKLTDTMAREYLRRQNTGDRYRSLSDARIDTLTGSTWASDAPAKAMFRCGRQPAAYLLFQDVISAIRSSAGLYLGSSSDSEST